MVVDFAKIKSHENTPYMAVVPALGGYIDV